MIHTREACLIPEESFLSQIRREEENLVINTLSGSFWNKNAPFDAFWISFCSIEMFFALKMLFSPKNHLCREQMLPLNPINRHP
jgi:hypothetical protein